MVLLLGSWKDPGSECEDLENLAGLGGTAANSERNYRRLRIHLDSTFRGRQRGLCIFGAWAPDRGGVLGRVRSKANEAYQVPTSLS